METFTWPVSLGTSQDFKARVLKTQYGDGYAQKAGDGLNSVNRTYSVVIKANSIAMADEIEVFLEEHHGAVPFGWTPPRAATPIAVTCEEWRRTDRVNSSLINATFVRENLP